MICPRSHSKSITKPEIAPKALTPGIGFLQHSTLPTTFIQSFIQREHELSSHYATDTEIQQRTKQAAVYPPRASNLVGESDTAALPGTVREGDGGLKRRRCPALKVLLLQYTRDQNGKKSVQGQPQCTAWRSISTRLSPEPWVQGDSAQDPLWGLPDPEGGLLPGDCLGLSNWGIFPS